jgi:transcription elongation factor Elf1
VFHKHQFGKVESDGYQYCSKCGKANQARCNHKWDVIQVIQVFSEWNTSMPEYHKRVLQCMKCGDIKTVKC